MLTFRDLVSAFKDLGIEPTWPLIVHTSLSSLGEVRGGAETVLGALMAATDALMMPAFTYKTMITPLVGPDQNGIVYGSGEKTNRMAEFFWPSMPADPSVGIVAERFRQHPHTERSGHPILSFCGLNTQEALETQTMHQPLSPIGVLAQEGGWVLLLGVDHRVNTSIHYAERLANRTQFSRWALTPTGIVECRAFPGCSEGFNKAAPLLEPFTHQVQIGKALARALPLKRLVETVTDLLEEQPQALLCERPDCGCCNSIRAIGH